MPKVSHANRIARAYAQNEIAEAKLIALGVPERKIYRAWKGQTLDRVSLRSGELLGVIGGLRGLIDGDSKKEIVKAIARCRAASDAAHQAPRLHQGIHRVLHRANAPEADVGHAVSLGLALHSSGGCIPQAFP